MKAKKFSPGRKYQRIEDAAGLYLVTSYEYNNLGQVEKTVYPDGKWERQIRNGRGLIIKTITGYGPENTDPNDFIVTEKVYDSDGNVIKELKAGIVETSYELDNQGRVYRQYFGDYEAGYCDYIQYSRDITGDIIGRRTFSVDDNGIETCISKTSTRYNLLGQVIQQTTVADPNTGEGMSDRIRLFSYDKNGRQIEAVTKADGNDQPYLKGIT